MDKLTLKMQYTEEEYVEASRRYLFLSKTLSVFKFILVAIVFALLVALIILDGIDLMAILVIILLVITVSMGLVLYFVQPRSTFRKSKEMQQAYDLILTEKEMIFAIGERSLPFPWTGFQACWVTESFFYLIQGKNLYTFLPRRIFASPEEEAAFQKLAQTDNPNIKFIDKRKKSK